MILLGHLVLSNRGVFKATGKNLLNYFISVKVLTAIRMAILLSASSMLQLLLNDHFNKLDRFPVINCPLYEKYGKEFVNYAGLYTSRCCCGRRSLSVLSSIR
jgi:hypothetical protein